MSTRKQIEQQDWKDRLQTFSTGNRGRIASLNAGDKTLVELSSFQSAIYHALDKGDELVINLKDYSHSVKAPVELYLTFAENSEVIAMEVKDQNGNTTLLKLMV